MRFAQSLIAIVALALSVEVAFAGSDSRKAAVPASSERRGPLRIPGAFQRKGASAASTPYTFTLHLKSASPDALTARMEANAASLGNPLSIEELRSLTAADATDLASVKSYLTSQGIETQSIVESRTGDQITVNADIATAAKLFATSFSDYVINGNSNTTAPRTTQYVIPAAIANAVRHVSPLTSFVLPRRTGQVVEPLAERDLDAHRLEARAAPAGCDTQRVTPTCLRNFYRTAGYTPTPTSAVDTFVFGAIGQNYAPVDLNAFLSRYRPDAKGVKIPVINRGGAFNVPLGIFAGVEAMLDVETVVSQTYPLKATYYNYGTQATPGDIFALTFDDLINNYAKALPEVLTMSYGASENDLTADQAAAMCRSAQKLTALGTTIIVASGDSGVSSPGDQCPAFVPSYPSGCPYITSVGATQNFGPEVAVDPSLGGFYSGSGFSRYFDRPSFQTTAGNAYLAAIGSNPPQSEYRSAGRIYPDVSAQGSRYVVTSNYVDQAVSGTSASAPTFASIVALLNDARRKAGKGRLGWINPFLYSNGASALTDVTSGAALGCNNAPQDGFSAKPGYDAVGGLGTPDFVKLRSALGV